MTFVEPKTISGRVHCSYSVLKGLNYWINVLFPLSTEEDIYYYKQYLESQFFC